jgi:hypothetical protein
MSHHTNKEGQERQKPSILNLQKKKRLLMAAAIDADEDSNTPI